MTASWVLRVGKAEHRDVDALARWAREHADPVGTYHRGVIALPALERLGARLAAALHHGDGLARVVGVSPELDDPSLRLMHLAVGLSFGTSLDPYGRLFDVYDRGEDFRASAVPVSMTREPTSFHTDSSARSVLPDHVGLLCLQPARHGGESLVSDAVAVHDELSRTAPELVRVLYQDFARDVVTPGAERTIEAIRANRFPVFALEPGPTLTFRYMRYWIERAHQLIDEPLPDVARRAFDRLDGLLAEPRHAHRLRLERGELLWVNNRTHAHDRTGFADEPGQPRRMVRLWTVRRPT